MGQAPWEEWREWERENANGDAEEWVDGEYGPGYDDLVHEYRGSNGSHV